MAFAHPEVLLLLPGVTALTIAWLLLLWRGARRYAKLSDIRRPRPRGYADARRRRLTQLACLYFALNLGVIALARPRGGTARADGIRETHDLVILLDVSRSMLARDVFPNRLDRSKALLRDLAARIAENDRIAIAAFRDGTRILCPLTRDTNFLLLTLAGIDTHAAPRGPTSLARAITGALQAFEEDRPGGRTVLMVSDGEDLSGGLDEALAEARRQNAVFLSVGIGTPEGAPIPDETSPDGYQHFEGERIVTRLDHATLARIAAETGGAYLPLEGAHADLTGFYRAHRADPGKTGAIDSTDLSEELFAWFLLPAFVCFLAAGLISRVRPGVSAGMMVLFLALTLAPSHAAAAAADAGFRDPGGARPAARRMFRRALRAERLGDYAAAAAAYEQASASAGDAPVGRLLAFNAARAQYHAGNYTEAVRGFEDVLRRTPDPPPEWRFGLAAAHLKAAGAQASEPADAAQAAALRQTLIRAATQAQQAILEMPERANDWRGTLDALDAASAHAAAQERLFKALERHGGRSAPELADMILRDQRELREDMEEAGALALPEKLDRLRTLAERQFDTADLLEVLTPAFRGDRDIALPAEAAAGIMRAAADLMADADATAGAALQEAENAVYRFWKDAASKRSLAREALARQRKAADAVSALAATGTARAQPETIAEQRESLDLTGRLRERLGRTPGLMPPSLNGFDGPETYHARLSYLAQKAADAQTGAARHIAAGRFPAALSAQTGAAGRLQEIIALMTPPRADDGEPREGDAGPEDANGDALIEPPDRAFADGQPAAPPESGTLSPERDAADDETITGLLERIRRRERDYLEDRARRARLTPPAGRDW